MLQDRDGMVWAGTKDGLTRYNAYEFDVIRNLGADSTSLSSNNITALCQDLEGNVWVGTSFGLNVLDPVTLKARRFYHWSGDEVSLSNNKVTALVCDQYGHIWIGTENGLSLYNIDNNHFINYSILENDPSSLSSNHVNALLIDHKNTLWVGTDLGLNKLQSNELFERYKYKFDDNNSLSDNEVLSIEEDFEGHLWIGTRNGLNRFHPSMNVFTRYYVDGPKKGMLSSNIINALLVDPSGHVWVGTSKGLNQMYMGNVNKANYNLKGYDFDQLPRGNVTSLMIDRSGLIWIGTLTAGIATLNHEAQRFFTSHQNSEDFLTPERNKVHSFWRITDQQLLVGTGVGVISYVSDGSAAYGEMFWKEDKVLTKIDVAVRDMVTDSEGKLWLATDGMGLLQVNSATGKILKRFNLVANDELSISSNKLTCIVPTDTGDLWIGTMGGGFCLFNRSTETFKRYRFTGERNQVLRDNNITCMALSGHNDLWMGTGNSGLYLFKIANESLIHFKPGDQKVGFLGSGTINDLHIDRNKNLWIATGGSGLCMLPHSSGSFTTYSIEDGLASNVVLGVRSDFENNLWITTNGGISAFNTETVTFMNYNENDIPGFNIFFAGSTYEDNESRIYFGGANGFNYFYAEGLRQNKYVPPVRFCNFMLFGGNNESQELKSLAATGDTIKLRHDHPGFTVEFSALNYKEPDKNQYAYRLKGLFDEWRYLGNRRFATFSNLTPGLYTLEVKGSNNDGFWNEQPSVLTVWVRHAYWQTNIFKLAVVLVVLYIFYALYVFRLRREKERNMELEEAVKDRTHEIAKERDTNAVLLREVHHRVKNNLQIIVSLLSLQSRFITDRKLVNVFDEVQNRVRSMSLIHQKMYQSKDLSTVNIAEYIGDLSENLLNTYKLSQKVNLHVNIEVHRFKSDTLTPLGLIINEIISNALKYAFVEDTEGNIFVEIKPLDEVRYRMIIGDDGVGISAEKEFNTEGSFGTELIEALTEQLNGTITHIKESKGTVYQIDFEDLED